MKIEFELAHDRRFIAYHASIRKGDSLRRLQEDHMQISRSQFSDQLLRQNHLTSMVGEYSVSPTTIKDRPRMCQQVLQQFMDRFLGMTNNSIIPMYYMEKEIVRCALNLETPLTIQDVCQVLSVKEQKVRQLLKTMLDKNIIESGGKGTQRIKCYRPTAEVLQQLMG